MQSSGALDGVLRLQGLKNVRGKKVLPGAEFLEEMDKTPPPVEGVAQPLPNFANFLPENANEPQPEMGAGLSPQSYDVRANAVVPPENEEKEGAGILYKLGKSLGDYFNPQKRNELRQQNESATQNVQKSLNEEFLPSVAPSEPIMPPTDFSRQPAFEGAYKAPPLPETSPGFFGPLRDYLSPTKRAQYAQSNEELLADAALSRQGLNPEEVRNQKHEEFRRQVQEAKERNQPLQGAAQEIANHPALQAEFKTITGIDYEPVIADQISTYEESMKGVEDALTGVNDQLSERAQAIKDRILNNQATDADKYYIGLALAMPLIIGGIFGKEAGVGALGGAAKGLAGLIGNREKSIREDEQSLLNLNKEQASNIEKLAGMSQEKAKFGPTLRKNYAEQQPEQHLMGMREIQWTDPQTGEEQRGVEIKPGLIARPQFVASKEGRADMLKAANELSATKTFVNEINDLTDEVTDIVVQLDDPNIFQKIFIAKLTGQSPTAISKLTPDIMYEGKMVNSGVLLEEKLGFLANAYGMAKEIGQLDRAAQAHIKKIFENPTSTLLSPRDSLSQMQNIRNLAQQGLLNSASNQGFYPEFVVADLEQANKKYEGKENKRENDTRLAQIKRKALQSETNYAQ